MAKFHVDLMLLEGGSIMYLIVLFGQKGDQKEVGLWKQIFRFFFFFIFFFLLLLFALLCVFIKDITEIIPTTLRNLKKKEGNWSDFDFLSKAALIYGIKINLKNAS